MDKRLLTSAAVRDASLAGILFLCTMAQSAFAANYYISSSTGDDRNSGLSSSQPWKTLVPIYTKSQSPLPFFPGDSILLFSGDSWDGQLRLNANGTAAKPIRIGSYGSGPKPIIFGDNRRAAWASIPGHPGVYQANVGSGSILSPVAYLGAMQLVPVSAGRLNVSNAADLNMYLNSLPPGGFGPTTITSAAYVHTLDGLPPNGLKLFRSSAVSLSGKYLVLSGLSIQQSYAGIDLGSGDNITVQANDVQDTLGIGIYLRGGVTDCLVEGNTTTRSGNTAIYILGGGHNTIRSNQIAQVTDTVLGIRVSGDKAGIGLQQSNGNLVESNTISNVKTGAVDYYYEVGSTVRYNYVYRAGGGIFPHGTDLEVYSNIFNLSWSPGNGTGGGINAVNTGSGSILVFNNVFYGTGAYGLAGSSAVGFVAPDSRTAAALGPSGGSVVFRNNIVVGVQPSGILAQSGPGANSDYNCFFSLAPVKFGHLNSSYPSLATLQSATGLESHSFFLNPRLSAVNPVQPTDFQLLPGSPCIAAGADVRQSGIFVGDYSDFAGVAIPQGLRPNIGAYAGTAASQSSAVVKDVPARLHAAQEVSQ